MSSSSLSDVDDSSNNKDGEAATGSTTTSTSTTSATTSKSTFNETAYEQDRLRKDQEAMDDMKQTAELEFAKLRTPWKWVIRKRIWDYMETHDIANYPRHVHHRIPNFKGADKAAKRLANEVPEFATARIIKVNPDTPQKQVRYEVLKSGKTLLTPQPRLRTGFFSTINMEKLKETNSLIRVEDCVTSKGVAQYGTPVTLYDKYTVDLVVVGSTAVCPNTGARVGKGEGFAELEWGILSLMGNLDPTKVLVVTTVHECQIVNDIPADSLTKHDVPVDIIVTPERVIRVPNRVAKPCGVHWDLLSQQKLNQIKVLRDLKQDIEQKEGTKLPSGPDETLPPTASRGNNRKGGGRGGNGKDGGGRRPNKKNNDTNLTNKGNRNNTNKKGSKNNKKGSLNRGSDGGGQGGGGVKDDF